MKIYQKRHKMSSNFLKKYDILYRVNKTKNMSFGRAYVVRGDTYSENRVLWWWVLEI